jgi:hypothetical protein
MNQNQKQQGDVTLSKIGKLPSGLKRIDTKGVAVLAEGETTGHYHGIHDEGVALLEDDRGNKFVENKTGKTVMLTHQEHKPIQVEHGIWEIGIVREHDYFMDMERKVID